jgi:hypothetical protein
MKGIKGKNELMRKKGGIYIRSKVVDAAKIVIVVAIIGIVGAVFVPGIIDETQAKSAAKGVLGHAIDQNYEEAFESVYFYDVASDLRPTISYDDAKEKWINRVKALKEKGIYVVDYKGLSVRLDDTYPVGRVDLIIMENGEEKIKEDVSLWFAQGEGSWKVGNFEYFIDDQEEEWEYALSGHFQ